MLFILSKVWKPLSVIFIAVVVAYGVYSLLPTDYQRDLSPVMEELSIRSAKDFANKVPRLQNVEDLLVVPIVGGRHEDQRLSNIVFDAIAEKRKYTVWQWADLEEKISNGSVWQQFLDKAGLVPGEPPKNEEEAQRAINLLNNANFSIDGVLFIKCYFDQGPRDDQLGAKVELKGQIYSAQKKKTLEYRMIASNGIESVWNLLYLRNKIGSINYAVRLILCMLISFGPAWLFIGLTRFALKTRNNSWILTYLIALTLIGLVSTWSLLFVLPNLLDLLNLIFFMAVGGLIFYVNHDALGYIDKNLI